MVRIRPWATALVTYLAVSSLATGAFAAGSVDRLAAPARAGAPSADGSAASTKTLSAHRRPMTTIVLRVTTCAHCPIFVQQALDDGTYWTSRTHHVRAGKVTFLLPTRRTRGMTFGSNPRWPNVTDAVTNIVTRYAHTKPGQIISNDVARHKKRATACWSGTSQPRIVMQVRIVKFSARAIGGGPGHAMRAWFKPMKSSLPPMTHTWRGTLGNQDAYFCST
jgi:hypothetical protein